jgi:hypothetical protein
VPANLDTCILEPLYFALEKSSTANKLSAALDDSNSDGIHISIQHIRAMVGQIAETPPEWSRLPAPEPHSPRAIQTVLPPASLAPPGWARREIHVPPRHVAPSRPACRRAAMASASFHFNAGKPLRAARSIHRPTNACSAALRRFALAPPERRRERRWSRPATARIMIRMSISLLNLNPDLLA